MSQSFLIAKETFTVIKVDHIGCCGYICLAKLLGYSNWIAIARKFVEIVDNPFFTAECVDRIHRLKVVIDVADEGRKQLNSLDSDCHLTSEMCKSLDDFLNEYI
jgi:hypothetical protein